MTKINLRTGFNNRPLSKIIDLREDGEAAIKLYIKQNQLEQETIYTTFNEPVESLGNSIKNFKDADIGTRKFILIDLDPKRPSGVSSTNEEKEAANQLKNDVITYLKEQKFVNMIEADSGNGYHILIPLNEVVTKENTERIKLFLKLLSNKFNNEFVDLDTTVSNASRLTKLYGTKAVKGKNTLERPHRLSKLLTTSWSKEFNSFDLVTNVIKDLSMSELNHELVTTKSTINQNSNNDFVYADAKKWLEHYNFVYREKSGDVEGMKLFIFETCPLKIHSTNVNGASLQQSKDGKIKFTCLHGSHDLLDINDFAKKFPIPDYAGNNLSVDFLLNGGERIYEEFKLNKNGVFRYLKEDYVKISGPIFISEQRRTLETNEIEMKLNYFSDGDWLTKWISGLDLMVGEFRKLAKYSVPVFPRSEQEIITFLLKQKESMKVKAMHQKIGWSSPSQYLLSENFDATENKSTLEITDFLNLIPRGSYYNWRKMIEKYVLGNSGSELGLAIGFSSIVVGYLSRKSDEPKSLICSMENVSSSGKTTMLTMCAYLYSSKGLLDSFNATENSIIEKLNNNFGLVYSLDEWNSNTLNNPTRFLYQLSSGVSRMKLDSNSNIRKQAEFATTIITSSETSIRAEAANLRGIDVRILPFSDIAWTKDAKSSDAIKRISKQNSGVAAVEFMTKLFTMEDHDELIMTSYELAKEVLFDAFEDSKFKSRLLDQYAMILTAGYLIDEVLGIELNEVNLIKNLVASYSGITQTIYQTDIDYNDILVKVFSRNKNAFKIDTQPFEKQIGMKGRYVNSDSFIKVQYFKSDFESDLQYELEKQKSDAAISEMIKLKLLKHEIGRRTKRVRIDKMSYVVYEFELLLVDVPKIDPILELKKNSKFTNGMSSETHVKNDDFEDENFI